MLPIPNPIAVTIFGIDVMWYGVLIAIGILFAILIVYKRAPRHDIEPERIFDIVMICLPFAIIGARAYYVLFNWEDYQGDFYKIINTRLGGLAIHGGLIVGVSIGIALCLIRNIRPLNALDLVAPAIALAQAIGRWGNYFNQEAHGTPTNLPWAIQVGNEMVHPTFLYESIWCFLLFLVLIIVDNHRKFEGQIFLLYGILYSFERFFIEHLRTDSLMIGPFRQAQVFSAAVFIVFLLIYIPLSHKNSKKGRIFY
ncbi:prolipoprotein diacylglyceryl transferase [Sinanaerobacter sp. ZZT-01]|uniref:prolipoprotein diacylglyceryl transferase n=1 Tax=Sinanaerobacter sp. ZZT-01 TaxID=3111540 RepID=UPI002D764AB7|nr:prolipoprotein diacylglyceryl transferase [Sinanaerobacter sp. ZZT-01]WRR93723.1 prolipoprotein diacylglyceryl transferase [Sinanaerobacter sp. ZZT-01]